MSSFIIVKLEILRKMKKIYVLFMSSLLLLSCAKDDVSKPSEWPEWPTPSKPKIVITKPGLENERQAAELMLLQQR